jgi:hypothetical protein
MIGDAIDTAMAHVVVSAIVGAYSFSLPRRREGGGVLRTSLPPVSGRPGGGGGGGGGGFSFSDMFTSLQRYSALRPR